jgi:D-glycero-D-manno-heptose 1,7-bisphosphate phosphatase
VKGLARAVFLDRDGTVAEEKGYMYTPADFDVFPWTGRSVRRLNEAGFLVVLVTNQSGVGRGYFTESTVERVHEGLRREIARAGGRLDAAYVCPHSPDAECACRKPRPGLLTRARDELNIALEDSFMVGDRYSDVAAGRAAGARTILVMTGDGTMEYEKRSGSEPGPDHVARTLAEAVETSLGS